MVSLFCRKRGKGGSAHSRAGTRIWVFIVMAPVLMLLAGGGVDGCFSRNGQVGYVGTSTCMGCHDGRSATDMRHFVEGPHNRISCETCHGPGYQHVRAGGRGGILIDNPAKLPFAQSANLCSQCHGSYVENYRKTTHATAEGASCHDCHDTHRKGGFRVETSGPPHADMNIAKNLCGQCHASQTEQFLTSGHAQIGVATCISCHDMHQETMFTANPVDNSLCLQCHGSSFLGFNSQANIDFHTGDFHPVDPAGSGASRCITCHMPPLAQADQPFAGFDHSMMTIPPALTNELMASGVIPVPPNSCAGIAGCHDSNVPGSGLPFDVNNPVDNSFLQEVYEAIGELP